MNLIEGELHLRRLLAEESEQLHLCEGCVSSSEWKGNVPPYPPEECTLHPCPVHPEHRELFRSSRQLGLKRFRCLYILKNARLMQTCGRGININI